MNPNKYSLFNCTDTKDLYYELISAGFTVWAPMITRRTAKGTINTSAAVPGYMFVRLDEVERLQAWSRKFDKIGFKPVLGTLGQPVELSTLELLILKIRCDRESPMSPLRTIYRPGDKVLVEVGAYKGLQGVVKRVHAKGVRLLIGTVYVGVPQQFVTKI